MAERESNGGMIHEPAFVQITLGNGTQIRSRAVKYVDPDRAGLTGAFRMVDREGVATYVAWEAIAHLTVFPLGTEPRDE